MNPPISDQGDDGETTVIFPVTPGDVLEIRLLLQSVEPEGAGRALGRAKVSVRFLDSRKRVIDPYLATGAIVVDLPESVEVLPSGPRTDAGDAAATAIWYLPAPPDAVSLRIGGWADTARLRSARVLESAIDWGREAGRRASSLQTRYSRQRERLIRRLFPETTEDVIALACHAGAAQMAALQSHFKPGGDWAPVLSSIAAAEWQAEAQTRRERLRAQGDNAPRIGFIGSERGFERLSWLTETIWLREAEYLDQFRYLDLEIVVVEAAATGGGSGEGGEWNQAFASLTGDLPERGSAFFDAARDAGVPVHLWATGSADGAPAWRGAMRVADRVIVEGTEEEWAAFRPDHVIRRATEPAACSLAALDERKPDLLLVPTASDAYQFPAFRALIDQPTLYSGVLAEYRYNFAPAEFARHFNNDRLKIVGESNRMMQRYLLQAARVVLLPATSLRPPVELAQIAMDAISSGAIPILYGNGGEDEPLLSDLDRIHDAVALRRLLLLLRIDWFRERRLRALLREVWRNHVWRSRDRAAILGRDPFAADFDQPKITVVLVTKRPHLIENCLDTFRKQTWPNKELVLIFNTGSVPSDLPELARNERVFALPEAANIGECLNMGVAAGRGKYWVKVDDDDFYSRYYLEETAGYYRTSQADITGRQSIFYYFDAIGQYQSFDRLARQCFKLLTKSQDHISGATLSSVKKAPTTGFSQKDRNACDANWVRRNFTLGTRMFCGDSTSLMVYRDADESKHTWQMSRSKGSMKGLFPRGSDMFERMEET